MKQRDLLFLGAGALLTYILFKQEIRVRTVVDTSQTRKDVVGTAKDLMALFKKGS